MADRPNDTPTRPPLVRGVPGDFSAAPAQRGEAKPVTEVLAPSLGVAFLNCGIDRMQRGETEAAVSDFTEAIRIEPDHARAWCLRGYAHAIQLNWARALADLRKSIELRLPPAHEDNARLRIWVARARLGESGDATQELRDWFARRIQPPPDPWILRIASFLGNSLPEREFVDAIRTHPTTGAPERTCETWYFVAEKRLSGGDKSGAQEAFERSVTTGAKGISAWISARAALLALKAQA